MISCLQALFIHHQGGVLHVAVGEHLPSVNGRSLMTVASFQKHVKDAETSRAIEDEVSASVEGRKETAESFKVFSAGKAADEEGRISRAVRCAPRLSRSARLTSCCYQLNAAKTNKKIMDPNHVFQLLRKQIKHDACRC